MGEATGCEVLLGLLVLRGERIAALGGLGDAGVGEVENPGGGGGVDDVAVLGEPLADLVGRDQQHLVDADEGLAERVGVGVVGHPDLDTLGSEIGGLVGVADDGDDVTGCHGSEQRPAGSTSS